MQKNLLHIHVWGVICTGPVRNSAMCIRKTTVNTKYGPTISQIIFPQTNNQSFHYLIIQGKYDLSVHPAMTSTQICPQITEGRTVWLRSGTDTPRSSRHLAQTRRSQIPTPFPHLPSTHRRRFFINKVEWRKTDQLVSLDLFSRSVSSGPNSYWWQIPRKKLRQFVAFWPVIMRSKLWVWRQNLLMSRLPGKSIGTYALPLLSQLV